MNRSKIIEIRESLRRFVRLFPSNKEKLKVVTLCLLAATTFWFFSALNKSDYTTRIEYPVAFSYQNDSTYVLSALPEHVLIEVSGGGWNLLRKTLLFDTPPVEVALEDPVGTKYITGQELSQQIADKLGEVRLNYVVTDTLFFSIDQAATKEVSIALDSSSIRLGDSYQITSPITLNPVRATITGPKTVLEDLSDTLYVSLSGEEAITTDMQQSVMLDYSGSDLVTIAPDEVRVSFKVTPFDLVTRSVEVTQVGFPQDSSLEILPNRVDVTFWIQNEYIDLIQNYDFEVVVNLRRLNLEDSTLTPVLKSYPKFAKNIAISPSKLRVQNAE